MKRLGISVALTALLGLTLAPPGGAESTVGELIAAAAAQHGVAADLLSSIVWVESRGWPWALNAQGLALYPRTRAEAERALAQLGDNVDIGYAQVNYHWWGRPLGLRKADLLDPQLNLQLGAWILRYSMSQETGWWGVGRYHSATWRHKVPYAYVVARVYQAIQAWRAQQTPEPGERGH